MLATAHFNGEKKDDYHIARNFLDPPEELEHQIFPWIETEELNYKSRCDQLGRRARDESLVSFLLALRWFRRVLLQDVAALCAQHGANLPILSFSPFNSPGFAYFASGAGAILQQAETAIQSHMKDLPKLMSQAYAAHLSAVHVAQAEQKQMLQQCHSTLELGFKILASSGTYSAKRKALSQIVAPDQQVIARPPPAPSTPMASHPLPVDGLENITPLPPTSIPLAGDSLLASTPLSAARPTKVVSGEGNVYSMQTFPLSGCPEERGLQMRAITKLEQRFPAEKLQFHSFEWLSYGGVQHWVPEFKYWKPRDGSSPSLRDIWREYSEGIGHHFSILELVEVWDAKWKRDQRTIKNEWTRWMKVVRLIESLVLQNGWSPEVALKFLDTRYPIAPSSTQKHLRSSRLFQDWLKDEQKSQVLAESTQWDL